MLGRGAQSEAAGRLHRIILELLATYLCVALCLFYPQLCRMGYFLLCFFENSDQLAGFFHDLGYSFSHPGGVDRSRTGAGNSIAYNDRAGFVDHH